MSDLDKRQLKECQIALNNLRNELDSLLTSYKTGSEPVSLDMPIGRLSRMDAIQQQKMSQAQLVRAQRRLAQVLAAEKRIAAGTYGECVKCSDEIGYSVLKVYPEILICRSCRQESS